MGMQAVFDGDNDVVLRLWSNQESGASDAGNDFESDRAQYGSQVSVREVENWNNGSVSERQRRQGMSD